MKYLLMIYDNAETRAVFFGDEGKPLMAEMDAIMTELRESGELVDTAPLADPASTKVVRNGTDGPVVTDGPLAEAKEHFGGYLIVDVESEARAVEIATRWPKVSTPMEVRPLLDVGGDL
ncbi:YciI family protein [Pseudonocardia pini]|uniref:YciI family protein n=1 Tax=Pseudonocardia pini TaxID=2758030 RepID=UPI0015F11668|nr:YciI family protein [Pseudonocardia pini]